MQFACGKGFAQGVEELAAEGGGHGFDWEKEVVTRPDPAGAIGRNATYRNHGMYVRMML